MRYPPVGGSTFQSSHSPSQLAVIHNLAASKTGCLAVLPDSTVEDAAFLGFSPVFHLIYCFSHSGLIGNRHWTYFGLYLDNGGVEADVRHRVNEGCKVLGALKGVMKNRGLGMNVKKVLFEKVVVPTLMYGSESWGMKVTERQKLNVFEMKCLRSMTGVSRLDRVRNEVVRTRTGVRRELATRVDMNVLRWFGHVERMDAEQLLKKVVNAKVNGRSAIGSLGLGGWME